MPESLRDFDPCLSSLKDRSDDLIEDRNEDLMELLPRDLAGGHADRIRSNSSSVEPEECGLFLLLLLLLLLMLQLPSLTSAELVSLVFAVDVDIVFFD